MVLRPYYIRNVDRRMTRRTIEELPAMSYADRRRLRIRYYQSHHKHVDGVGTRLMRKYDQICAALDALTTISIRE